MYDPKDEQERNFLFIMICLCVKVSIVLDTFFVKFAQDKIT